MKFSAVSSLLATLAFVCSSVVNAELNPEFTMATSVAFDSLVLKAGKPVVVLFCIEDNATCGQAINELNDAIIVSAQPDEPPQVSLVFVDVKASPELAKTYQATALTTYIGFHHGKIVTTHSGQLHHDEATQDFLQKLIES